ncbi:MAG: DUF308 domain-containing protein [Acidimicrobiia bacterium]|nr:DUF308 domain-containing protein [Acidimicrobiia bacterium]
MSRRSWLRQVLPWWAVPALGVACVVLGAVLTARPLRSLSVLALLTAAALVITGIGELTTAAAARRPWLARLAGVVVVASGAVVVAWPGVTILVLAFAAGVGLVVGGLLDLAGAVMPHADDPERPHAGDNRLIVILGGATSVIVGVIALSWPAVTVLVLAVAFGLRTVVFGVGLIAAGWRTRRSSSAGHLPDRQTGRRWPPWVRTVGTVAAFVLALAGMAVSVAVHRSQPGEPGARSTSRPHRCPTNRWAPSSAARSSPGSNPGPRRTACCTCRLASTASRRR